MDNIYDLFRKIDELERRWLASALDALTAPQTLTERNWVQLMLADRHQVQFRTPSRLVSLQRISPLYAARFPH